MPPEKSASSAVNSYYGVNTNWYTDTRATDHITSDLNRLSVHEKYNANEQIRTISGAIRNVNRIGYATVSTPSRSLFLNDVLHVPQAKNNLASVHRLATDNHAFLEFHRNYFFIKDKATKKILLRGKCEGGLY